MLQPSGLKLVLQPRGPLRFTSHPMKSAGGIAFGAGATMSTVANETVGTCSSSRGAEHLEL